MPNWRAGAGGAASGAAIGTQINPGWGTAIGAAAGGLLGLFAGGGGGSSDAGAAQRKSLDEAMHRLQDFSAQQYQNRQQDLQATMAFYGPAENYLKSIYGGAATGPQALAQGPGGPAAPPPGFPRPQPSPTPLTYAQPPRRGY